METTTKDLKVLALAEFLEVGQDEIVTDSYDEDLLNYGSQEYLVLTDEEADKRAEEDIKNSLWAFNPEFIIRHCKNYDEMDCYEFESAVNSLKKAQESECENLNGLVYALIDDMEDFVEDAIIADGRGHFISYYDGYENEVNIEGETYYIYRM